MDSQYQAGTEMIRRLNESKLKDFDSFVTGHRIGRKQPPSAGVQLSSTTMPSKEQRSNIDQNILDLLKPIPLAGLRGHKSQQDFNDRV